MEFMNRLYPPFCPCPPSLLCDGGHCFTKEWSLESEDGVLVLLFLGGHWPPLRFAISLTVGASRARPRTGKPLLCSIAKQNPGFAALDKTGAARV